MSDDATAPARPAAVAGAPTRIGRYRIVAELGAGGMGKVYRAHDPNLGREVAVKTVLAGGLDDPGARGRFNREARGLAALRHDNILAVYDYSGLDADPVYLVTELIDGEDLAATLARGGRLSAVAAIIVLREVAAGLAAAHAAGLIHRDVKPANVLVDRRGRVVLADFGVARPPTAPAASASTQSLTIAGTPGYMSPEQIEGRDLDSRSDLWSLGATGYQLATGERPFGGRNLHEALGHALAGEYRRAVDRRELDADVARLIDRCLARERAERPGNADEVVVILDRVLARLGVGDRRAALVAALGQPAAPAIAAPARLRRGLRIGAGAGAVAVVAGVTAVLLGGGGAEAPTTPTAGVPVAQAAPPVDAGVAMVMTPIDAGVVAVAADAAPAPARATRPSRPAAPGKAKPAPTPATPTPPSVASSRDPATLTAEEQKHYGALLQQALTAEFAKDFKTERALADQVLERVESQIALYYATTASCELGDATAAQRYHARLHDKTFRKTSLDRCVLLDIFVNEEAKSSQWAVFRRMRKASQDGYQALQRGDYQALRAQATLLIDQGQDADDVALGHEFAVRAACGLGDAALAQRHLAGAEPGHQAELVESCRRGHDLTLTAP